jgi:hypothetical protein
MGSKRCDLGDAHDRNLSASCCATTQTKEAMESAEGLKEKGTTTPRGSPVVDLRDALDYRIYGGADGGHLARRQDDDYLNGAAVTRGTQETATALATATPTTAKPNVARSSFDVQRDAERRYRSRFLPTGVVANPSASVDSTTYATPHRRYQRWDLPLRR